ncbi:hypothetical protein CC2G_014738 [Coprinopsis cinerea AmutBmut pab1-1]|nr:hypothetical protein CC2G_014738 [Coprinopsis cinerea AmutBmut pab1-1]
MDGSISESASTVRTLSVPIHILSELQEVNSSQENVATSSNMSLSLPSSPRSSALPSPPDSPSDSVSSLPSVTSSFFFSSAAASPGHFAQPLDHDQDHASNHSGASAARNATSGLIIPSLTLPPALRRPTPYGQTLGEVRLLVLGRQGAGKSFLTGLLFEDNEEVVEVGTWEDPVGEDGEGDDEMVLLGMAGAKVLRASTDWVEHTDAHGLEKFEPARNVEIVEFPGYDAMTDGNALVDNLRSVIRAPFHTIADTLHPNSQPSALLANLISSAATPLFTALILLLPSAPTALDRLIIDSLGGDIPIIVLSTPPSSYPVSSSSSPHASSPALHPTATSFISSFTRNSRSKLSAFRPSNAGAVKNGVFRSPETISVLRMEAAERFMRWREVERAVAGVLHDAPTSHRLESIGPKPRSSNKSAWDRWDKEKWEREWMEDFSRDVSIRLQERGSRRREVGVDEQPTEHGAPPPPYNDDTSSILDGDIPASPAYSSANSEKGSPSSWHNTLIPHAQPFDPLHLPSLFLFTVSMLGPLKARLFGAVRSSAKGYWADTASPAEAGPVRIADAQDAEKPTQWRWFVLGGLVTVSASFCAGMSIGAAWASK